LTIGAMGTSQPERLDGTRRQLVANVTNIAFRPPGASGSGAPASIASPLDSSFIVL